MRVKHFPMKAGAANHIGCLNQQVFCPQKDKFLGGNHLLLQASAVGINADCMKSARGSFTLQYGFCHK